MSKIAVIKTGGKQYKVKAGEIVKIEKLPAEPGKKIAFDTLMISEEDGKKLSLGRPSLGEKVQGEVIGQGRDKKVAVVKYKNKTRYLRNKGHRQSFTQIKISAFA